MHGWPGRHGVAAQADMAAPVANKAASATVIVTRSERRLTDRRGFDISSIKLLPAQDTDLQLISENRHSVAWPATPAPMTFPAAPLVAGPPWGLRHSTDGTLRPLHWPDPARGL